MADIEQALLDYDNEWKNGDRAVARMMCQVYVDAHREELAARFQFLDQDTLIGMVSAYRAAGQEADRILTDMWMMNEFAVKHITGVLAPGTPDNG